MTIHVCTNADLELGYEPTKQTEFDIRDSCLTLWEVCQLSKRYGKGMRKVRELDIYVRYGIKVWSRRKRQTMDVDKMVADWRGVIVTLCTAHDKAEIDKAEYRMDELLSPILTAPVKELRAFYTKLSTTLKDDAAVPFFIWSMFDAWGELIVKPASDDAKIKKLRRKLAGEIAVMVDKEIQPDIATAVAGALMWRPPEALKEIKKDLKAGAKPRLKGRESCLFLVTQKEGGKEHQVML